jgi:hypothetical protein
LSTSIRRYFALVAGDEQFALCHHRGGDVENDRLATGDRNADRDGIRGQAPIAATEGRDTLRT